MSKHILLVDDDALMRRSLAFNLEQAGYRTSTAGSAEDGLNLARRDPPDLILLDIGLPGMDGLDALRDFQQQADTPIIFVTARRRELDQALGLELGADDYVTKPFSLEELLARIHAVLRRTDPTRSVGTRFDFGDLQVDAEGLTVFRDQQPIQVSEREFRIIQFFAANPSRIVTRDELYEQVWEDHMSDLGTRTVDMHMAKLRAKIELDTAQPTLIQTVRGSGYRYEP